MKKTISIETRQSWDIWLWFIILAMCGSTIYFLKVNIIMAFPTVATAICAFVVMIINNNAALKEMKK